MPAHRQDSPPPTPFPTTYAKPSTPSKRHFGYVRSSSRMRTSLRGPPPSFKNCSADLRLSGQYGTKPSEAGTAAARPPGPGEEHLPRLTTATARGPSPGKIIQGRPAGTAPGCSPSPAGGSTPSSSARSRSPAATTGTNHTATSPATPSATSQKSAMGNVLSRPVPGTPATATSSTRFRMTRAAARARVMPAPAADAATRSSSPRAGPSPSPGLAGTSGRHRAAASTLRARCNTPPSRSVRTYSSGSASARIRSTIREASSLLIGTKSYTGHDGWSSSAPAGRTPTATAWYC